METQRPFGPGTTAAASPVSATRAGSPPAARAARATATSRRPTAPSTGMRPASGSGRRHQRCSTSAAVRSRRSGSPSRRSSSRCRSAITVGPTAQPSGSTSASGWSAHQPTNRRATLSGTGSAYRWARRRAAAGSARCATRSSAATCPRRPRGPAPPPPGAAGCRAPALRPGEVGLAVEQAAPRGLRDRVPPELGGAGRGRPDRGDLVEVDERGVVVGLGDERPDQRRPEDVDRPGPRGPQPARDPDRGARVDAEGQPHRERRRLPLDLPRDGAPVGVALAGQLAGDLDRVDDVERVVGPQEQRHPEQRLRRRHDPRRHDLGGAISGAPSSRSRTR